MLSNAEQSPTSQVRADRKARRSHATFNGQTLVTKMQAPGRWQARSLPVLQEGLGYWGSCLQLWAPHLWLCGQRQLGLRPALAIAVNNPCNLGQVAQPA